MTTLNPESARPPVDEGGSGGASRHGFVAGAVRAGAVSGPPSLLGGCSGVLDLQGPVGAGEKLILLEALAIMMAIVAPVIVATLAFAWWFRASNRRARYLPDWEFSGRVELVVWSIPALVITICRQMARPMEMQR